MRDGEPVVTPSLPGEVSASPEKRNPLTNSFQKYLLSAYGIPGCAGVLKIRVSKETT